MRQDIEQLKPSSVKETTGKQPAQPVPPAASTLPPPPPPTAEEQSKLQQLQVFYSLLCNMSFHILSLYLSQ